jgi:hypothetical protein
VSPPNPVKFTSVEVKPGGAGIAPDADAPAGGRPTTPRRTISTTATIGFLPRTVDYRESSA